MTEQNSNHFADELIEIGVLQKFLKNNFNILYAHPMDKISAFWEERRLMLKDIESDFEVYLKEKLKVRRKRKKA